MTTNKSAYRIYSGSIVFLIVALSFCSTAYPDTAASAKWLPYDTLAFFCVDNANQLGKNFKQTSIYNLYKDPAMQPFIAPAEKEIRAKIDQFLKKAWQEIHLEEPPKELPWPTGKIMVAVFIQPRAFMIPDFSAVPQYQYHEQNFDTDTIPKTQHNAPDFQVVFLAQMGDKLQDLQKLSRRITAKAVEEGVIRQRQNVRGVEFNIIKPTRDTDENYDTFCYGFKKDWLIAGSSIKYIKQVLMRMDGSDAKSLADNKGFQNATKTLGDSDMLFYFNVQALIDVMKNTSPPEKKVYIAKVVKALGFENVSGLAMTLQIAANKNENVRVKALLVVQGTKTGIPAMLTPKPANLNANRMLQKNTESFLVAKYDIPAIYDEIIRIAWTISNFNVGMMIQSYMMTTGNTGLAPVDLRQDVIGQLAGPITITRRLEKPYNDPQSPKTTIAIGVHNAETIDSALARLHDVFIAMGNKDLRRELMNCTIYLLPSMGAFPFLNAFSMHAAMTQTDTDTPEYGFAVAGDQLVLGNANVLEQAIRDLRRKDIETINSDPMYQYAAPHIPNRAGVISYQNNRISSEFTWTILKEAAREKAAQKQASPDANSPSTPDSPMKIFLSISNLLNSLDFTALPDFQTVKKHFGVTVGYVTNHKQGILAETISLKAPTTPMSSE